MATSLKSSIFSLFILCLSTAQSASKPRALILPITKDASTLQYVTRIRLGTPLIRRSFVLDLGGENLWMACESGYNSSTYKPGRCGSAACSLAKANGCFNCVNRRPGRPGCTNNTCSLLPDNTVLKTADLTEELAMDTISLQTTDGSKSGPRLSIPSFIFSCATDALVEGLARGTKGMAGLGRNPITLPFQLSSSLGGTFRRKFALCLPYTSNSTGILLFGESPYNFYASDNVSSLIDITERLQYTKLFINPFSGASAFIRDEASAEYFVAIKSITVDKMAIAINTTLLAINARGTGGSRISTVDPYTVLQSSIYTSLAEAFTAKLKVTNVTKVAPVRPFTECYSTEVLPSSQLGYAVPDIGFVFEGGDQVWEVVGANSVVEISRDVVCLGFIDGGVRPRTSIVIGGHQIENNLLQFDLTASRLGFSSNLFWAASQCENFKL